MWDVSAPYVRNWIRDELGPEAALADRIRTDVQTLLRLPALVRRIEDMFPPRGGAPEQPPLPAIRLRWDERELWPLRLLGYAVAALAGAALLWAALAAGWLGRAGRRSPSIPSRTGRAERRTLRFLASS
jgi:ubiquinone biosynthesis protein